MFQGLAQTDSPGALADTMTKAFDLVEIAQAWLAAEGIAVVLALGMSLVILLFGRWGAGFLRRLLGVGLAKRNVDTTLSSFLCNIAYMAMMAMVVISALEVAGIATTSFVAVLGAAGLAVGFALQGSLSNFASGVMIILFRPFQKGDFVEIAGVAGVVLEVQVVATTLKTGDNKKIIVPNGSITRGNITNYSSHDTRRIDMVFGIGYDDDIRQAKELFERVVSEEERVLEDPEPQIAVAELADSSVNFVIRPWVKSDDYWSVKCDLNEKLKIECDKAGISIPYPQRDVHLHQTGV